MATMTWVGRDAHARSTEAAAINVLSGELRRTRFGAGVEPVVAWLQSLPQPLSACYEAGPTGYGLYRAAGEAGLAVEVIAPSKTPRAAGDRVKSDRKDAELLVRLLMAGALTVVRVPPAEAEAARDLTRARDQAARRPDAQPSPHLQAAPAPGPRLRGQRLDGSPPALARRAVLHAAGDGARLPRRPLRAA